MTEPAPAPQGALPERLARAIALAGPIPLSQFMAAANAHYYATRDPLGRDFVTAPEISQMFGELVGLWCADAWDCAGQPDVAWVELGPGRGTLAVDACRAMSKAGLTPPVHFVETSPILRAAQAERVPEAMWHDDLSSLPTDRPLLVVANEFFDALPIRQLVRAGAGEQAVWRERLVACQDTLFLPIAGPAVPDADIPEPLRAAPPGAVLEVSPAQVAIIRDLARRLTAQGGALLVADYGHEGPALGETLQAVRGHAYANPFADPGEQDLTAHVDFTTLAAAAQAEGAAVWGPVEQGEWLVALGVDHRAAALARAQPDRADDIAAARMRLVNADAMGRLFKLLAVTGGGWTEPAGFARTGA
jgi:NADH dehydrogenase [ubiquinone] 1 alpha subcomplex assembly factor 7